MSEAGCIEIVPDDVTRIIDPKSLSPGSARKVNDRELALALQKPVFSSQRAAQKGAGRHPGDTPAARCEVSGRPRRLERLQPHRRKVRSAAAHLAPLTARSIGRERTSQASSSAAPNPGVIGMRCSRLQIGSRYGNGLAIQPAIGFHFGCRVGFRGTTTTLFSKLRRRKTSLFNALIWRPRGFARDITLPALPVEAWLRAA